MARTVQHSLARVRSATLGLAGGPARARVVLILACVLGLSGADMATISATAGNLERSFGVGNTQIGLLLSVTALAGALLTIPVGILTDRTNRTRLLAGSIACWGVATVLSAVAFSYSWLMLTRVALGAVTATTGPTVASLTGDFFPAADRGRVYGLILAGDLVGSGIGFVVSGDVSAVTSWRLAVGWLALPCLALAWLVWRLPEPARGGHGVLPAGARRVRGTAQRPPAGNGIAEAGGTRPEAADGGDAGLAVRQAGVEPQPELILHTDPATRPLLWAVRYVLRVRTNVVIIVVSGLGYFYFAGLRSFAVLFATSRYGISKATATSLLIVIGAGALAGVFAGGRVSDRLLRGGHVRARVLVPAVCLLALTPVLAPAIITTSVAVALPLLIVGAFLLGAPNPPLDAARLDIIHPRLWGRAEAVRTLLRSLGEASAPILFGYVSQYVFSRPGTAGSGGSAGAASTGSGAAAAGLEYTFLVFLIALLAAGLLALVGLRTYPRDVATARASTRAIAEADARSHRPRASRRPG